jgi:hypothetical protein
MTGNARGSRLEASRPRRAEGTASPRFVNIRPPSSVAAASSHARRTSDGRAESKRPTSVAFHVWADGDIALTSAAGADRPQGRAGTPAYMAPEQVTLDDDRIDTRTDLYGAGAILFEILADRPSARGAALEELHQDVAAGRIPRAREVDPTVPAALDSVCAGALSLKPEDRYTSAAAPADDVRRWMIDEPVSVYRDPLTVRLTRRGRRHRTLVTSAAAVLIVATTAALLVASQQAAHAPAVAGFESDLATSLNNIGPIRSATGLPDVALESHGRAPAMIERLARENPESPDFASGLGATLNNIATIDPAQKRYVEARAKLEKAIVWQNALTANPNHPQFCRFLANRLTNLIRAADGLTDPAAAAEARRELDELKASDPRLAALDARLAPSSRAKPLATTSSGPLSPGAPTILGVTSPRRGSGPRPSNTTPGSPTTSRPGTATTPPAPPRSRASARARARTTLRPTRPPGPASATGPAPCSTPSWKPGRGSSNPLGRVDNIWGLIVRRVASLTAPDPSSTRHASPRDSG